MDALCRGQVPSIVQLVDRFDDNEFYYFVTEYTPFGDLKEFVRRTTASGVMVPEPVAKQIIRQIASALNGMHKRGFVHCDVKVDNILVTAPGSVEEPHTLKVRLADLGSSVHQNHPRVLKTRFIVGTDGYIAPELLLGHEINITNDVWALGCLLHYMLSL